MTASTNNANKHTETKLKKIIFYVITALIPLVFFVLVELALRLAGFGQQVPLFIDNPAHPSYQLPRPDVLNRYFPINAPKPSVTMETNFILKDKPLNGYRVIVQGGSTAAGFPYGLGASIAGTLDQRLKPSLRGNYVEVLNTAMSAVNSYTLLDFVDEIIEQQPDAVLIYAGHNEFLGILGVGSNYTAMGSGMTTRWFLRLKNLRIFQLIQHMYFALAKDSQVSSNNVAMSAASNPTSNAKSNASKEEQKVATQQAGQQSRTFMAKVAKNKTIAKNSSVFDAGIAQFETNMTRLLKKYQDAGIQVYLSTVASNHADQAPFSSSPIEEKFKNTADAFFSGIGKLNKNAAITELNTASTTFSESHSADLHFALAKLALQIDQTRIAKTHFALAVEHDLLRFRAPAAINQIIVELARKYNAVLVDAEQALSARSPHGIIGKSMMLEHLHPNLQAYFVISNAFYDAMATHAKVATFTHVSIERAWAERLVLPQEEYYGFATILNLTSDYPFTDIPKLPALPNPADWQQQLGQDFFLKKLTWLDMMESSLLRYKSESDQVMMAKTIQILADALPHNGLYNLQIAEIKYKQNRLNESLHYYKRAKLAGAVGGVIDSNIKLIENALAK